MYAALFYIMCSHAGCQHSQSSGTTNGGARVWAVGTAPVSRKDAERPRARRYLPPRPEMPSKGTCNAASSSWHTTHKQGKDTKPDRQESRVHRRYGEAKKTLPRAAHPAILYLLLAWTCKEEPRVECLVPVLPSGYAITHVTFFPRHQGKVLDRHGVAYNQ